MGAGHHGETGTNAVLLAEMEHKSVMDCYSEAILAAEGK